MRLLSLAASFMLVFFAHSLEAATYYVSASGKDANTGTSKNQAWASIGKVNGIIFSPGDSVLFEGSSTFTGNLYFDSKVKGTAAKPIYLGSYGSGRATISSGSKAGLYVYNSAGFKIRNLVFMGSGRTSNTSSGVEFYMELPNNTRLNYIAIDSVEAFGYRDAGLMIGSWSGTSGYDNISITNCSAHDNGDHGITTYAEATLGHRNVYIGYSKVFNNSGLPEKTDSHSGNGIVLGGVDGGIIEHCEAYNNGWLNAWASGGPVGIWGYKCNNLVIQYNESHHNRTGTTKDGGGFDIDGGCTNSIMQYNYSHDNEGAGYLVAQYVGAPTMKGIIVRYNISENDGRKNGYGAIHLWASGGNAIQNLEVYNNTVYLSPASSGSPKALCVQSGGAVSAQIRNNIFQVTNSLELVNAAVTSGIKFEGNDYWATGSSAKFKWGSTTYATLDTWRTATGQEKLNGIDSGYFLDPELKQPGRGVTVGDTRLLYTLQGYEQKETSLLIGKGINLATTLNINTGKIDFFGNSIVQRSSYAIGAHQQTENSKACLNGGAVTLQFGTVAGGTYSGPGVTEGKYFNPLSTGTGNSSLTYSYTDKNSQQQLLHHTITVVDDSTCPPTNTTVVAPVACSATGTILREQWNNVSGSSVADIPLGIKPSSTSQLSLFEAPTDLGNSYGARVSGYICPPATGDYTFFIAGDDNAELWLSTSDSSENKRKIAFVTGWTSPRQWNKYASQKSASVRLEAGKKYYIEALHKEASGGDNLAVAWTLPDGKMEAPIAGSRLSPYTATTDEAPAPSEPTPTEPVLTSCSATGSILREQWNNVSGSSVADIPLSTSPSSTSQLSLFEAPSGIGNSYGARVSGYICPPSTGDYTFFIAGDDNAELWLSTSDSPANKRKIASVTGWTYSRQWNKYASQKSAAVRLEAGKKYYIEALHKEASGGDNLAVAWTLPDGKMEAPIAGSRLSPYTATTDEAPAPSEPTPTEPVLTSCSATGSILREQWNNVSGSSVADIPLSTSPSSTSQLSLFEAPSGIGGSYGTRVSGYICPPATGDYTFFIAGDDNAELWLSTSDSSENKRKIAFVTGWTSPRQWNKYASQKSASVRLEAGKKYYIEALHKQGWGGDNLAVAWRLPDGKMEAPIAGSRLSPYMATATSSGLVSASEPGSSLSDQAQLMAYPNPFTTNATVQFTLTASEEVSLELYDIQGRLVRRLFQGAAEAHAPQSFEMAAEGLTRGVYIIRLVTGSKVLTQKIVLEK